MSRHATLMVAGLDATPDTFGELEVAGGRGDFLGEVEPATLSVSMEWPVWRPLPVVGDGVQVAGWLPHSGLPEQSMAALFAGQVTDVAYEDGIVSLVAVDQLRRLDGLMVGDEPWPAEPWPARLQRLRDLIAARLPAEDRGWWGQWWGWPGTPSNLADAYVAARDVDRQDALGLVRDHLRFAGQFVWAMPHFGAINDSGPAPADIRSWAPATGYGTIFPESGWFFAQVPEVFAAWIVDDPGPRNWQNLGTCINRLEVTGPRVAADGRPPAEAGDEPTDWVHGAAVAQAVASRHGPRSGKIDTPLAMNLIGQSLPFTTIDLGRFAAAWLARTGWPVWACDGVSVDFTRPDPDRPAWQMRRAWLWLAQGGPCKAGQPVVLHGVGGSTVGPAPGGEDDPNWIIEQRTIRWTEEGWEVDLESLTDPAVYRGTVGPPIDPRSNVSLMEPPRMLLPSGGTLLRPLLLAGGVQGAAGGWWRIVAPDAGLTGPVVVNRGAGTLVPTPAGLPPGAVRLVVQWLDAADATAPRQWMELRIQVRTAVTWRDLPDGLRWADVPVDVRWMDADELATTGGGAGAFGD